jgi:hypothetical protein
MSTRNFKCCYRRKPATSQKKPDSTSRSEWSFLDYWHYRLMKHCTSNWRYWASTSYWGIQTRTNSIPTTKWKTKTTLQHQF